MNQESKPKFSRSFTIAAIIGLIGAVVLQFGTVAARDLGVKSVGTCIGVWATITFFATVVLWGLATTPKRQK